MSCVPVATTALIAYGCISMCFVVHVLFPQTFTCYVYFLPLFVFPPFSLVTCSSDSHVTIYSRYFLLGFLPFSSLSLWSWNYPVCLTRKSLDFLVFLFGSFLLLAALAVLSCLSFSLPLCLLQGGSGPQFCKAP